MPEREQLLEMLRRMYRIRFFEEGLREYYDYRGYSQVADPEDEAQATDELLTCVGYDFASEGMIGGAVHLSIGQEAVSVGVCSNLNDDDHVVSSHRSHGHAIAKGCDVKEAFAELMGRSTGLSRGYGGSMHLFDPKHGFLGGNGIVGGQIPVGVGPAFAAKYRGTRQVAVIFFGDGAANQGTFHETMNIASLWKLPAIFVCENNLYANTTPSALSSPTADIAPRAKGYGVRGEIVDGQDLLTVHEIAREVIEDARDGKGPALLEMKTYRFEGHCGVSSSHQNLPECEEWKKRDPIALFERYLKSEGIVDDNALQGMRDVTAAQIEEAAEFAKSSPFADVAELAQFEA